MDFNGIVRVILALSIPLFIIGIVAIRLKGLNVADTSIEVDGILSLIEAWETILVAIISGLTGYAAGQGASGK